MNKSDGQQAPTTYQSILGNFHIASPFHDPARVGSILSPFMGETEAQKEVKQFGSGYVAISSKKEILTSFFV